MKLTTGLRIMVGGTIVEAIGIILDILHHLNIGIETAEGLVTANHLLIFVGFIIHIIGLFFTISKRT